MLLSYLGLSLGWLYLTGKCGLSALKVCFLRFAFCPPNLTVLLLNCLMLLLTKPLLSMVLLSILLLAVLLKLALHASITRCKQGPLSLCRQKKTTYSQEFVLSPTFKEIHKMIKS